MEDISKIIFVLMKKFNGILNLGTGKGVFLKDIARIIAKKYDKELIFFDNKKTTYLVANISELLKVYKFKNQKNRKNYFLDMIKVLFESSIFLHQNVGGISKYINELNKNLLRNGISSKIFSPITVNYYLDNDNDKSINFLRFSKIPKFCRKIFFFINNISTFIYIKIYKPDIVHFSYYNKSFLKIFKLAICINSL